MLGGKKKKKKDKLTFKDEKFGVPALKLFLTSSLIILVMFPLLKYSLNRNSTILISSYLTLVV